MTQPTSLRAKCNLFNELQPDIEMTLKRGWFAAMTYGSRLRLAETGDDPIMEVKGVPGKTLITPEFAGHKLKLNLWHGRKHPDEQLEDWGFNHNEVEGYTGPPSCDAMVFLKEGVKLVTYKQDGTWDEVLIPFVGDLLFHEGNYYGDYSADNDGSVK